MAGVPELNTVIWGTFKLLWDQRDDTVQDIYPPLLTEGVSNWRLSLKYGFVLLLCYDSISVFQKEDCGASRRHPAKERGSNSNSP